MYLQNENKKITVSVVTVVRNAVDCLKKTVESIISQSYESVEYILIDGGSTDGTIDLIKYYHNHIDFWSSEKDNGIYDAMNKGIRKSNGDFVIFMNAGDTFFSQTTIEQFILSLSSGKGKKSIDLAYGDSVLINQNGKERFHKARNHTYVWYGMFAHHQTMFFSKKLLDNLCYDTSYQVGGDYALVSKICCLKPPPKFLKLDFPVCVFQEGGLSYTQNGMKTAYQEDVRIKKGILGLDSFSIILIDFVHRIMNKVKHSP